LKHAELLSSSNLRTGFSTTATAAAAAALIRQDEAVLLAWKMELWAENINISTPLQEWVTSDDNNSNNSATADSPCGWSGVQCGIWLEELRVTELNLTSYNLSGVVPPGIANLTALSSLVFAHNRFNGSIPAEIGNLTNLQVLDLSSNSFQKAIPEELFSNCGNLRLLNLSNNLLVDGVPEQLWRSCKSLKTLDLSSNNLTAAGLPITVAAGGSEAAPGAPGGDEDFPNQIMHFAVSDNNITALVSDILGSFFTAPGHCQNLEFLDLSYNNLWGSLPPEIGNCTQLRLLNVQGNQITGLVPDEIGGLRNLECLGLGKNQLYGNLPQSLTMCTELYLLDASRNQFSGLIPSWLSKLQSLQFLVMHSNSFTGDIPIELFSSSSNLLHLDLGHNNLSGFIPPEIGNLGALRFLRLSRNQLTGSVPSTIGNLSQVTAIDLSGNLLTGSIPATIGELQNLLWLQMSENLLSGSIPGELSNCGSLLWLNLYQNQLTGEIPATFSLLGQMANITFANNRKNLQWPPVDLSECSILSSWIPGYYAPPFTNLIWILNRQWCQKGWEKILRGEKQAVALSYWQLSSNNLTGQIPEFSTSSPLACLLLGENSLSGPIPSSIGNLHAYIINVSRNEISGSIPDSLCNNNSLSQKLQTLDLSHNNLSGGIPSSIVNLTALSLFNISYNPDLTGPLPEANQFVTFGPDIYVGDTKLCFYLNPTWENVSAWTGDNLPERCPTDPTSSSGNSGFAASPASAVMPKHLKLIVTLTVSVLGCLTALLLVLSGLLCASCKSWRKKQLLLLRRQDVELNSKKLGSDQLVSGSGKSSTRGSSSSGSSSWGRRFSLQRRRVKTIPVEFFDGVNLPPCLQSLTYSDLLLATDGFSDANVIGDGGFGIVYKARLGPDNTQVAIKKLFKNGVQGEREFQAEMETLGNIRHQNLVPLLGYCCRHKERLLVYKFMENGSLDHWLYSAPAAAADHQNRVLSNLDSNTKKPLPSAAAAAVATAASSSSSSSSQLQLDWSTRLRIAHGTARGLCFLHHECVPMIIHRDMKVSNILLDEELDARLTDFGLARLLDLPNTHVSTIIAGTPGYVAPEYSQTWKATTKGDVYSFGVVLLELVAGKRPTAPEFSAVEPGANLVDWVRFLVAANRQHEVCDKAVLETAGDPRQVGEFLALALSCTLDSASKRPTMIQVTAQLQQIMDKVHLHDSQQNSAMQCMEQLRV